MLTVGPPVACYEENTHNICEHIYIADRVMMSDPPQSIVEVLTFFVSVLHRCRREHYWLTEHVVVPFGKQVHTQ